MIFPAQFLTAGKKMKELKKIILAELGIYINYTTHPTKTKT